MPINLTWDAPSSPFVIGYIIYRRNGSGDINTDTHFLATVPATPLSYDDENYDRTVLQSIGYTYAVSALGPTGESLLSPKQFITQSFVQSMFSELWDVDLSGSISSQFVEEWEFSVSLTPDELYFENWNLSFTEPPVGLEWTELWEKKVPTDPGSLEYNEIWEFQDISDPGSLEYIEDWSGSTITDPGSLEYSEDWE